MKKSFKFGAKYLRMDQVKERQPLMNLKGYGLLKACLPQILHGLFLNILLSCNFFWALRIGHSYVFNLYFSQTKVFENVRNKVYLGT